METPHKRFRLTPADLGAIARIMAELKAAKPWMWVTMTDAVREALAARDPLNRPTGETPVAKEEVGPRPNGAAK